MFKTKLKLLHILTNLTKIKWSNRSSIRSSISVLKLLELFPMHKLLLRPCSMEFKAKDCLSKGKNLMKLSMLITIMKFKRKSINMLRKILSNSHRSITLLLLKDMRKLNYDCISMLNISNHIHKQYYLLILLLII